MSSPFVTELSLTDEYPLFLKYNVVPSDSESFRYPCSCCEHKEGKSSNIRPFSGCSKGIDPLQGDGLLDLGIDLKPLHSQWRTVPKLSAMIDDG